MTADPHASLRRAVYERVLLGEGEADRDWRQAAAAGTGLPPDLQPLIDKIHRHAYKVTDEDIARVQAKYGDDKMFEIVVSAALGAARKRLALGLDALDNA